MRGSYGLKPRLDRKYELGHVKKQRHWTKLAGCLPSIALASSMQSSEGKIPLMTRFCNGTIGYDTDVTVSASFTVDVEDELMYLFKQYPKVKEKYCSSQLV
ncbi:hypothetical protein F2P81_011840 [Scophthalmus maximus]|uniref:Uncharacterized protein n=1 Tax=Scophthalmus maximus TaxID=52904 RepID=A0A6A4SWQ9_SCOMX|nr:hypothetical protein F2P81_011840 [Scophthalmus maximus]